MCCFLRKLDTSVDELVKEFEATWKPKLGDYSRELVEYCCSKTLRLKPLEPGESVSDSSFSRFTFDMMLAWQMPSSANEESYMECLGKEKEEKKLPLRVTPAHEDVSLFYSDIMPLLVDHGAAVEEVAFVWFASLLPLSGDVPTSRFSFETLTAPTANLLHYPAYDKFLKEMDKCVKHLQKQETPTGVEFEDDEFILHVEGTASSQRVVRHIGGESWPGKLTLTNYALYFEASGAVTYEQALKINLSKNTEQSVKPAATGPFGAPLFDKAIIYKSSELAEEVVLEFPEVTSSTRRDHWLALTKEIILLHQFLSEHETLSATQAWEMHARTILSIIRLHAAREMLRMAPPLPRSFLIFTLFDELPKGDYVLEELAGTLELIDSGDPCSASSILRYLNMPHELEPDSDWKEPKMIEKGPLISTQGGSLSTLDEAVTEVREQAKEIQVAKATTEGLKEEGVADSALVLMELIKPLKRGWTWFQEVLAWERPGTAVKNLAFSGYYSVAFASSRVCDFREWIGKALAIGLLWVALEMLRARRQNIKDQYCKVVVCTASDQTAMESIVSAQQGLRTAHDLVQKVNIGVLKIYSILLSRAPKQANTVMMGMVGIAVILMVVPFKYMVMAATLYLFATTSKAGKNVVANDTGNRRLKEWWDSIPVVPVELVNEAPEDR
ncbi:hypothetical protein Cgig2_025033 [Carnegiea gigantea]|uniref:Uncharacterized protein n=1 Tax=Carnegiea gigantea TaxID=171969 RepID=A0A9Q1QA61_9CARY|nr:hypothetical protein Cgig2_025033 [Carnegiea gigantea]